MIVLGLDSSMTHTGWVVLRVEGDPAGVAAHPLGVRVAQGTIRCTGRQPLLERIVEQMEEIQALVDFHRPDLVAIEGAITHGPNRSTTGTALYVGVVGPWHPFRAAHTRDQGQHVPRHVVTIAPGRLHRLLTAHVGGKATLPALRQRYATDMIDPVRPPTEHEIDAYYLAYYGARFVVLGVPGDEALRVALTAEERHAFFEAEKVGRDGVGVDTALYTQKGEMWWDNSC